MAYIPLSDKTTTLPKTVVPTAYVPLTEKTPQELTKITRKIAVAKLPVSEKTSVFKETVKAFPGELLKTTKEVLGASQLGEFPGGMTWWQRRLAEVKEVPKATVTVAKEFVKAPFRIAATIVDPWVRQLSGLEEIVPEKPLKLPLLGEVPTLFQSYNRWKQSGYSPLEAGLMSGSETAMDLAVSAGFAEFAYQKVPMKTGSIEMVSTVKDGKVTISPGKPPTPTTPIVSEAKYYKFGPRYMMEIVPTKEGTVRYTGFNIGKSQLENIVSGMVGKLKEFGINVKGEPVAEMKLLEAGKQPIAPSGAPKPVPVPPEGVLPVRPGPVPVAPIITPPPAVKPYVALTEKGVEPQIAPEITKYEEHMKTLAPAEKPIAPQELPPERERPIINKIIPPYGSMTPQQERVIIELDVAQKGERVKIGEDTQTEKAEWVGIPSTIPSYISEGLRNTKLIESVLKHIGAGTVPKAYNEVRLYNEIAEAMGVVDQAKMEVEQEIDIEAIDFGSPVISEAKAAEIAEKIDSQINEQNKIISGGEVKLPEVPEEKVAGEIKEAKPATATPAEAQPTTPRAEDRVGIIPQELQPLAQEARKYKSAEEFVSFIEKDILPRKIGAPIGVRGAPSEIGDKIIELQNVVRKNFVKKPKEITIKEARAIFEKAKIEGKSWAKGRSFDNPEVQLRAINEATPIGVDVDLGLTKSQLTDFYAQAVKGVGEEFTETLQKEFGYSEKESKEIAKMAEETEEMAKDEPFKEEDEEIIAEDIFKIIDGEGGKKYKLTPYGADLAKTQAFKEFMAENVATYGKPISRDEIIKIVGKYLTPDEISVRFTDSLIRLENGDLAVAAYHGAEKMMEFVANPTNYAKIPEHEVLHAYLDIASTRVERLNYYREALRENPEIKKNLRPGEELDVKLEEKMADDFVEYLKNRNSFHGRIAAFFFRVLSRIKRFFRKNKIKSIRDLFEDIIAKRRPAKPIEGRAVMRYKEVGISDAELDAYDYVQKGLPVPEELKPAIESLKQKGLVRESYTSSERPLVGIRKLRRGRFRGTITEQQIGKIEKEVQERGVSKQIMSQLRNGFTGVKRTRIEELSTEQADELFRTILELTPEEAGRMGEPGKIKLVDEETLAAMRDFIPPSILSKKYITTGDIFQNLKEKDINYIVSLFRPIRKVLTSGEIQPNKRSITEGIYDKISTAEEDMRITYKQWHDDYVKLYKAAKKEDRRVDLNVYRYIEQGLDAPPATKKLAEYLREFYANSLPVMKPKHIRQGYITHTAPTFWERVKSVGMKEALKEVVEPIIVPQERIDPAILQALDYIVSRQKFNPFALRRSKYSIYTKQLRKSVQAYASLYFYKKNFDPIMPAILKQKRFLPGSTQKYVTKYLQTVGGRPLDWGLWRGPFGRTLKRSINAGVRFEYGFLLGLNASSALGNVAGGNWNNIADIPPQLLALGHQRLATPQGRKILDKYHLTEQTLWLEPTGGVAERMSKVERGLFFLMQGGEFWLRGSAAMARIPEAEFKSGILSFETRAIIRRQLGRSQGLFGPAQAPILSQATSLRPVWMFKHWMINEIEMMHNFAKEYIQRYKANPSWAGRTIKNAGFRRIVKYIILGALFYLFGPEFLKKEVRQKIGIPKTLIGSLMQLTNAPLYQDAYFAMRLLIRAGNQEFREAQEDFVNWAMKKPLLQKSRTWFQGFFEGAIRQPDGTLTESITKVEAFKRFLVGNWTEQGQKEKELNEELSKLSSFENYTKWDQDFGSRLVKTDYQKKKEDIMKVMLRKGYWEPPSEDEENGAITIDSQIEDMFATYNGQVLKRLDKYFAEVEKLTGEPFTEKEKNSLILKATIQEKDIANWFQSAYEQKTIPRILRRSK